MLENLREHEALVFQRRVVKMTILQKQVLDRTAQPFDLQLDVSLIDTIKEFRGEGFTVQV